jgi:diadenosine tetraphosphatase ApaH/serine/threonine PP2A family protein phosphatase
MADPISAAAAQKIKALCAKVAVAHGLDEPIRHELCGHMEDELLAYLTGRRPVSEADALILVEKHFGDPAVIRDLFRTVHRVESDISVLRRLLGVATATFGVIVATNSAWCAADWITRSQYVVIAHHVAAKPISLICLWGATIWWTRRAKRGYTPWFDRLPLGLLAGLVVTLFVLDQLLRFTVEWPHLLTISPTGSIDTIAWEASLLSPVAMVVAWAWWCDWPNFGTRRAAFEAAAWVGMNALLGVGWVAALWYFLLSPTVRERATQSGWHWQQSALRTGILWPLGTAMIGLGLYWLCWLAIRLIQRTRAARVAQ